ncbi:biotin-dependent carboxyltransferase family protein [Oceanobacillus timonensis]|uniref:5-oxoprolinase subunit C family protein n=1 Tax=Oceanobacillus timonensis TaxID=1926285 RepID=UPI0009BA8C58|nr:biotin-dependent carboxyltransferase family protein [Oceanobacillus timonensis]
MDVEVVKPGMLTTVQDNGRFGFLNQGVLQSGAMDPIAMRTANLLIGNDEWEAVLELTISGPEICFKEDALIAVTGGGMNPVVNGKTFYLGSPIFIPSGQVLSFKPTGVGIRAYLSIAGGLKVPEMMNSKSTYLRAGFGGYHGRALQKKDTLQIGELSESAAKRKDMLADKANGQAYAPRWGAVDLRLDDKDRYTVRAFPGTHFDYFTKESQKLFFSEAYSLSTQADRMGFHFQSENILKLKEPFNVLSEAVAFGTVQVPNEGKPMVLMADRQTTGGYPRIAQVAVVDLPKLAQLRTNEQIHFEPITFEKAEELYFQQEDAMKERAIAIQLKWENEGNQ